MRVLQNAKKNAAFSVVSGFFKLLPLYLMLTRIIKPMFNLILFGPPGSGKGTQSEKLIAKYHLKHLSTGDLLRSEISNKTQLGLEAKSYMDKGSLVPDGVVIGMINDALDNNPKADGFLFDGFPRTAVQAEELDKLLTRKKTCIDVMLALKVSEEELIKRLIRRGETSGRSDDTNEQIIRARIEEYHKKTAAVADHYQKEDKVVMVKGEGSVDDIFDRLCKEMDRLKKQGNC
ncbi:MAG TPA: adenylate kinase [Hanamia sp.]